MEVVKEEAKQSIEEQFLLQARALGATVRIGQMNKNEHEGVIREIGRYDINIEEGGKIVTLLKQEVSHLTSPRQIIEQNTRCVAPAEHAPSEALFPRPNIQQEFLDKAIRENQIVTLYLMNGQRIKGIIQAYDNFTLLLRDNGKQHLYYKHAVTTINR